ncbi:hypothetical protein EI555_011767, partial [Monodon monoceros]
KKSSFLELLFLEQEQAHFRLLDSILSLCQLFKCKVNTNLLYFAHVNSADGGCLLEKYSEKYHDLGFALLANLFASEGQPGKVIEVKAKRRTGKLNFVTCMRQTLEKHYGDKPVGMGGTFVIQKEK